KPWLVQGFLFFRKIFIVSWLFNLIQIMKKYLLILPVLSLFFTMSCSSAPEGGVGEQSIESAEGDKVLLRLKPKVGDSQKTVMTMDMTSGEEQNLSMNMTMNMDMKVTDIVESVYIYEIKYNSI